MTMQQKIAQEKSKIDQVFDIIKNEAVDGKIAMLRLENLLLYAGVAPNWRKYYLKYLASRGKIRCDGKNVYVREYEKTISKE